MSNRLSNPTLMLSIVFWGTLLGGIAYSHLVYFPPYLSALPDSAVVVNGPYALHEVIFWMTIHPLTRVRTIRRQSMLHVVARRVAGAD